MRVLVTGAAGFIGSHLCERLLKEGHAVVGLDNFNAYYSPKIKKTNAQILKKYPLFKLIKGEILNEKLLSKIFKQNKFDQVVHLAARAGVRPSLENPKLYADVNIRGTLNLLTEIQKQKSQNQNIRFIFASSSSVYGNSPKVPFSEKDNVDKPISPYAATKKAAELICYNFHHLYNIGTACLRFFTVYGPRQRPEMGIALFTQSILKGQPITMFGNGATSRDYTYIDDIVDGIVRVMKLKKLQFEIFNLGNSHPISLKKLIELIEKAAGKKAQLIKKPMQAGDVERTFADIRHSQKKLGYQPRTSIQDGIKKYVNFVQNTGKTR
jgi:UDP-glucuronate 4-epimerase